MLGWFADGPNPDHGLLAFRQVSETLGSTPWYLRALRDEGDDGRAAGPDPGLAAGTRSSCCKRAPQTMQMLADDAELRPRAARTCDAEMRAAAGRHDDPARPSSRSGRSAAASCSGSRPATCSGDDDLVVGDALSDLAVGDHRHHPGDGPARPRQAPEIAVIGMGRWGGRELSYASDADAMFVMEDSEPGAPTADRRPGDLRAAPAAAPGRAPTRR